MTHHDPEMILVRPYDDYYHGFALVVEDETKHGVERYRAQPGAVGAAEMPLVFVEEWEIKRQAFRDAEFRLDAIWHEWCRDNLTASDDPVDMPGMAELTPDTAPYTALLARTGVRPLSRRMVDWLEEPKTDA